MRLEGSLFKANWANSSQDNQSKKWNGGVTQAVKHLLCKHEALNSISSPIKKKKKKRMLLRRAI
jgi:poly(A) polymerase Pap1